MPLNEGMFTSNSNEYETPDWLFDRLDNEFGFDLDPCASKENAKCNRYFTIEDDGLSLSWDGTVFMNPPYGRQIKHWVKKAFEEAQRGNTVVALIPSRTDTRYWHDYVMFAKEIRFIKGRISFGNTENNAPFPSAVIVFRQGDHQPKVTTMLRSRDLPQN